MTATMVTIRVKDEARLQDKLRGSRSPQHISDCLGARVAVDSREDATQFLAKMGGRHSMKTLFVLSLSVSALFASGTIGNAGESIHGRLYDRRAKETVGEIRQRGERRYDVYDRRGERKAYGVDRGTVIEFYDAKTSRRLPIELRKDR